MSLSQLAIISKVPSVWALSKLKSFISIEGGTLLATSGSVILGNCPAFIISSVMKGFNKDSSEGNPAIESEPAISTEATAGSVELNVHSNATGAIPDSGIVIISLLEHVAMITSEDFELVVIR